MIKTIDINFIRYINLLEKISHVRVKHCFIYNNFIVFVVPSFFISKAIGIDGRNVKKLSQILGKKVKIILEPQGIVDAEKFISGIVEPVKFKNLEISFSAIIIHASRQSKAILIGRNKARLLELREIVKNYFGKELRIG